MISNKAHGWDVYIHMIKLCGKSIVKPLKYLFESSLTARIFPEDWKKGNIVPAQKRKQELLRPISLPPIFSKIFERLIFSDLFKEATKSYFMHYSCVVIVLLNTALCRSAFPTVSLEN